MQLNLMFKIKQDKKLYAYLRKNSVWYKYLNRKEDNYKIFLEEYKKVNRINKTNKISETIDSLDMVSNILKVLE